MGDKVELDLASSLVSKEVALDWLTKLMREINSQDNRLTQVPLYCVQTKESRAVPEDHATKWIYIHECEEIDFKSMTDDEMMETFETTDKEQLCREGIVQEIGVEYYYRTVHVALTEKHAQAYMDRYRHNLTDPIIYVKAGGTDWEINKVLRAIGLITGILYKE
jgi:hypothetical protein